jgi:hypothetical protein
MKSLRKLILNHAGFRTEEIYRLNDSGKYGQMSLIKSLCKERKGKIFTLTFDPAKFRPKIPAECDS